MSSARRLLPALLLVALAGCSFEGSVSADGSSSSHPRSATGTAGSSTSTSPPTGGASSTATGQAPAGSTTSGATPGGTGRCHTGDLTGSLRPGDSGAGQRHATLVLTNTGGRTCTITGYGGVGLVDASGAALPTHQVRVSPPAPAAVTLRPGASAGSQLHWSAVPGSGDATTEDCQPTAATLQVIPPDETQPLSVPWTQGPVCERGSIDQQAYAAG
jgi:hypothetical protein